MDDEKIDEIIDNSNDVINETIGNDNSNETSEIVEVSKEKNKTINKDDVENASKLTVSNEKRVGFKDKNKKVKKSIIITISILILIVLIVGIFVCINKFNENVYNNVYILGENIGGYTSDEVKEFLGLKNSINLNDKIDIFQDTESIYSILENDIELKIDVTATLNSVMEYGRTGNIIKDNCNILKSYFKNVNIEPVYLYNETKLDEIMKNIDLSIKDRLVESSYSVDEVNKKLIITIGKTGNGIEFDVEKEKILNEIKKNFTGENLERKVYLDIKRKSSLELNPDEVYTKVKREPKDAYINKSTDPAKSVQEVVGIDIDINMLIEVLNSEENKVEGKIIEIPITTIEPNVKLEDLEKELYQDKLAGYTTYFDPSQSARANNLKIALDYLNGKVVMPGEVFSYNDAIGDTTTEKGYLPAATFKGGTTVNELGGGICQTTSTLYNVALMANLEIVERHQHGLPVGYVQPSRDATVYSPYLDFKFKNTRSNPIKIVTSYSSSGNLNISLYGIKEKEEYEVELISEYLSTIPYTTKYVYDQNMNEGQQVVVSKGVNGYTSQCFISKKLNGVQVSYDLLSKDTYNPQQQIVRVGTKKVNNTQES